ncbi:tigger transposable element-derived protein 1-like [Ctenocephalides felis]|uniref:tigger transposable element-derived protein 1-like n=1 Tax=Ctenocephalides felis TaxID=7515 RepID=UPI000E6E257F|nr:tigger transposable element-derived protein 1-like [Ctenocephalides felis]
MAASKKSQDSIHKRLKITIEMKHQIIKDRERGLSVTDLGRIYNRPTSTICTILKNKDKIKDIDASRGVTRISAQRLRILDDVERSLLIWIKDKQLQGDLVNENVICEKAKQIFAELVQKTPDVDQEGFKGSRGWFEKFKRRTGICSFGEASKADTTAADKFIKNFKKLCAEFEPQQVFNCSAMSLLWKNISKAEDTTKTVNKHRLSLLLCANSSGDFKLKPLLVYNSETPAEFLKYNIDKNKLDVMWRSHKKCLVQSELFADWFEEVFRPSVHLYLVQQNLPVKALLVLDSNLSTNLPKDDKILILPLPPNTAPLVQPMDQTILPTFKQLYTKELLDHCLAMAKKSKVTLDEFSKNHFHIVMCLTIINKIWTEFPKTTLTSAWKILWPEIIIENDWEGFESLPVEPVIDDRVTNMDEDLDIKEELNEDFALESDKDDVLPSSDEIQEVLNAWQIVENFVGKYHPNQEVAMSAVNLFNYNAVSHFREILERR